MVALQSCALLIALIGMGQLAGAGETVLLDFTADWCGPCKGMKPVVHQLRAAGHPVREVNIDRNRQLAAQYRVTSIPCFVMLVDGQEVDREVGGTSQNRLVQMLSKAKTARPRGRERALAQSPDDSSTAISLATHQGAAPTSYAAAPDAASSYGQPGAPPATAKAPDLEQMLIRAAVRLKVEDPSGHSYGTGTIVDAQGGEALILTCGHIFRDADGKGAILVELEGGHGTREVQGTLISFDLKRDLGLVSIRPDGPVEAARIAPAEQQVQMGDRVLNVGCNHGDAASARRSHVTGIDKYLGPPNIEVAGLPVEGRSGGGLFNERGQLIGVCFAADPADNEGVYAGLASIHAELDRLGLSSIYAAQASEPATQAAPAALAAVQPPAMPDQMPARFAESSSEPSRGLAAPVVGAGPSSGPEAVSLAQLDPTERAALAEIAKRSGDAEVICIIRPRNDPSAKSEIIVLNRASPQFIEQLSRRQQPEPHLTSLAIPKR